VLIADDQPSPGSAPPASEVRHYLIENRQETGRHHKVDRGSGLRCPVDGISTTHVTRRPGQEGLDLLSRIQKLDSTLPVGRDDCLEQRRYRGRGHARGRSDFIQSRGQRAIADNHTYSG